MWEKPREIIDFVKYDFSRICEFGRQRRIGRLEKHNYDFLFLHSLARHTKQKLTVFIYLLNLKKRNVKGENLKQNMKRWK